MLGSLTSNEATLVPTAISAVSTFVSKAGMRADHSPAGMSTEPKAARI